MPAIYTVVGGFPLMITRALDAQGFDGAKALADCDIDIASLSDPDARVPVDSVGKLMKLAISLTCDPAFGLKVGTFVGPTSFHALSMSMWLSSSLKDAFERLIRYGQLLSDAGLVGLEEREGECCYWTELADGSKQFIEILDLAAIDAIQSAMVTLARSVYGANLVLTHVAMVRDEPENPEPYMKYFECPVEFSQSRMALCFDRETLLKPLVSGHPELLKRSDDVIVESLSRFDKNDIVGRLRAKLLKHLPSGKPTQVEMASALHCSVRSLQRKLKERDVTYEEILSEVRREQGLTYITQPHLSIRDISYLLGFTSSTNFARTFKSWTGMTPSKYRRKLSNRLNPQA